MATSELTIAQGIHNWVKSYEKKTTRGGHTPAVLDEDTFESNVTGFQKFEEVWDERSPLGWDINDPVPAAQACIALLSDWFPATTGEIVHVDGGVHSMGG